jgi:hypothetical protein
MPEWKVVMTLLEYLKQARHILLTDPTYASRNLAWRRLPEPTPVISVGAAES